MSTEVYTLDPTRLASGAWCHRSNKTVGEGDISASYSADRIGMGQPVRKPFCWRGDRWLCVGTRYQGEEVEAEAYRLVPEAAFEGSSTTYAEKTRNGDAARADPNGFYHGMAVRHGGNAYVLTGPPVTFVPGQTEQLNLF